MTFSSFLCYSRDAVKKNPLLLDRNLLSSLYSLILCCSTSPRNRGGSRRCRYSYISIYPFLMAPCFPELEPSYSGSVGPVMLSGLVATLCNLRARAYDLGSALTAIPGGRDVSISCGPQMKNRSLRWTLLGKHL